MKICRLSGGESLVCERENLIFDTFIDFSSVSVSKSVCQSANKHRHVILVRRSPAGTTDRPTHRLNLYTKGLR